MSRRYLALKSHEQYLMDISTSGPDWSTKEAKALVFKDSTELVSFLCTHATYDLKPTRIVYVFVENQPTYSWQELNYNDSAFDSIELQ